MSDLWADAKGVLSTVAPLLATAVGGPLAGTATKAILGALNLAPDTPAATAVVAVQNATPDQLLALKKADEDFAVQIKQLGIAEEKLSFDDTANARARQIAVKDETPGILAYAIVVGFFALLGILAFHEVPVANAAALNIMVGTLGGLVGLVAGFYYGSSKLASTQSAALANSVPASAVGASSGPLAVPAAGAAP